MVFSSSCAMICSHIPLSFAANPCKVLSARLEASFLALSAITISVGAIPKLKSVEDIKSDYWIDILIRLCVAMTKIVLGRIRTRFTQSNALWVQDGERILDEGNTELKELREILRINSNLIMLTD